MDALLYLLILAVVVTAALAIAKTSGLVIPQPLLILIYAIVAIVCLYVLWGFLPDLPHHR